MSSRTSSETICTSFQWNRQSHFDLSCIALLEQSFIIQPSLAQRVGYVVQTTNTRHPHGELQTPVLFPVSNIGKRSSDNTPEYTDSIPDLSTAMVNARAIRNRKAQWDRLQGGATLRAEMDVADDTVIFADSGGFDFQEEEVDTTPAKTLETQRELGADIFGTVDTPLSRDNRQAKNQRRINRSIELALEASDAHHGDETLLASVHGYDPQTVRNSIRHLEKEGEFDGYAVGSLVPIRTDYKKSQK
ncbi:hypothetical protein VB779_06655 [Haloarculaceae archaeon H-GB11]|nr:hypothetical protein [Haloarculaceae archaeon H-GB11]